MTMTDSEMVWHNDGHVMHLRLEKSELVVVDVRCPETNECRSEVVGCLVRHFLHRYGLECNVGISEPSAAMMLAWTVVGDPRDPDLCQVWVIPVDDEAFAAWLLTIQN